MRVLIPIISIVAFLLSSCTGSVRSMLDRADAVMEEHPNSALGILMDIDRSRLGSRDLPYFALLMTQAHVKTDVPLDSDSLISIAYRKFAGDWWGDKGIRSNFYMGEIFFNKEKPRDAMKYYLTAYEESKRLGNDYWRAKSAERIADLFFDAYNHLESSRYRKDAIEYFGKAGRITNQRYAITDLAIDYMNDSRFDQAVDILDSIHDAVMRETPEDSLLLQYINAPLMDLMERQDNNKNYPDIFQNDTLCDEETLHRLYTQYRLARKSGNSEVSTEFVDSLLRYQNAMAENIIKESITIAERDFYSSLSIKNKQKSNLFLLFFIAAAVSAILIWWILRLRHQLTRLQLEASIESFIEQKSISDRLAQEKSGLEQILKDNASSTERLLASIIDKQREIDILEEKITEAASNANILLNNIEHEKGIVNDLTLSIFEKTIAIDKLKSTIFVLQNDINNQRLNVQALERNIETQAKELKDKDSILQQLFHEQWSTLNMLCNEYYEKGESPNMRRHIIDCIDKELKKVGSKRGISQIERTVNTHFNDMITKLRTQCRQLSEREINLATLIAAGLSAKSICYLLGMKTGNFYVSKRRLIAKIDASDALDGKWFIDTLNN